jgi:hypothetical protein
LTNRVTHEPAGWFDFHLLGECAETALAEAARRQINLLASTTAGADELTVPLEGVEKDLAADTGGIQRCQRDCSWPRDMIVVSR